MKRYSVIWAIEAEKDFHNLIEYLIMSDSTVTEKIFEEILQKADSLATFPERGRLVPEISDAVGSNIREVFFKPWRIIYRILDNQVKILMLIDGRKPLEDELLRFLLKN